MAEAVVENPLLQRFFCHECNSEVEHLLPVSNSKLLLCSRVFCGFRANLTFETHV